jgi:DNA-binding response OmpR family regulator
MLAIDPASVDHYQAACRGLLAFRTATGDWEKYEEKWPKLGPVGLRVLHALQLNPGDFLCPSEIAALTGWRSLERNGALTALIMRLRKAHKEQGQAEPWFIETKTAGGYGVRWPKDRTWMWIERVTPTTHIDR